jgi:hypothetical protein
LSKFPKIANPTGAEANTAIDIQKLLEEVRVRAWLGIS